MSVSRVGQSCYDCFGRGYVEITWESNEISFCKCTRGQELRSVSTRMCWDNYNQGFQRCKNHLLSLDDNKNQAKRIFTDKAIEAIRFSSTSNSS